MRAASEAQILASTAGGRAAGVDAEAEQAYGFATAEIKSPWQCAPGLFCRRTSHPIADTEPSDTLDGSGGCRMHFHLPKPLHG